MVGRRRRVVAKIEADLGVLRYRALHAAAETDQRLHLVGLRQQREAAERLKCRLLTNALVNLDPRARGRERPNPRAAAGGVDQKVVMNRVRASLHGRLLT